MISLSTCALRRQASWSRGKTSSGSHRNSIVAVDSDIITLLGPDGAAAVLHGSPRERRDGFLRAVAAAVPPDPTDSDLLAALPSEVLYSVVRGRQR